MCSLLEKNTAEQKIIGADVKKILKRQSQPTQPLMDTSVRAEDKFEEEYPEVPEQEKSLFGEVTSLGVQEDLQNELPLDFVSPEAKYKNYQSWAQKKKS